MDFSLLKKLTETPGVSGHEEHIREILAAELQALGAETSTDRMGNLIAHVPGPKGPGWPWPPTWTRWASWSARSRREAFSGWFPWEASTGGSSGPNRWWSTAAGICLGWWAPSRPTCSRPEPEATTRPCPWRTVFIDLGLRPGQVEEWVRVGDVVTFRHRLLGE